MPNSVRQKLLIMGRRITYLLRDEFLTAASVSDGNTLACEPGPGSLTYYIKDGTFAKTSGELVFTAQSTYVFGDLTAYAAVTRSAGLLLAGGIKFTSAHNVWNLDFGASLAGASRDGWTTYGDYARISPADITMFVINNGVRYQIATSLLATGSVLLQCVEPNTWLVHYINRTDATASLTARFANGLAAGSIDQVEAIVQSGVWQDAYGIATQHVAAPATGQVITTATESLIEFTWTPAAGESLDILFMRTDDNNCWIVRCDQAGGTIKLFGKVGGVETEYDSGKTQTWTIATPYRIVIKHFATRITSYVANVAKHSYITGAVNTATGAKVSGFATGANFASTPYRIYLTGPKAYDELSFLPFGDSKTWGQGDGGTNGVNGYPPDLAALTGYIEMLPRSNGSGWTVATAKAAVDASILFNSGFSPRFCLINLGVNDAAAALPAEATWKANYGYIIDAMRGKWPNARIGLMRPWGRGRAANCNTIAGWIADIVAARGYCFLGPDERVFLEGGDDGATYTTDGIHPNDAGYALTAAQWKTAMGL